MCACAAYSMIAIEQTISPSLLCHCDACCTSRLATILGKVWHIEHNHSVVCAFLLRSNKHIAFSYVLLLCVHSSIALRCSLWLIRIMDSNMLQLDPIWLRRSRHRYIRTAYAQIRIVRLHNSILRMQPPPPH